MSPQPTTAHYRTTSKLGEVAWVRLDREARAVESLDHPNIAVICRVEQNANSRHSPIRTRSGRADHFRLARNTARTSGGQVWRLWEPTRCNWGAQRMVCARTGAENSSF